MKIFISDQYIRENYGNLASKSRIKVNKPIFALAGSCYKIWKPKGPKIPVFVVCYLNILALSGKKLCFECDCYQLTPCSKSFVCRNSTLEDGMKLSRRVTETAPYLFHLIDEKRKAAQKRGIDVISLAIGDPDMPTPDFVLDLMNEEMRDPRNHQYPSYKGEPDFCEMVADWFEKRFGVRPDAKNEIMATIGSKDAVSHLPFVFIDPGDTALVTDPGYPAYEAAIGFAGGTPIRIPLLEDAGSCPTCLPYLKTLPTPQSSYSLIIRITQPQQSPMSLFSKTWYRSPGSMILSYWLITLILKCTLNRKIDP